MDALSRPVQLEVAEWLDDRERHALAATDRQWRALLGSEPAWYRLLQRRRALPSAEEVRALLEALEARNLRDEDEPLAKLVREPRLGGRRLGELLPDLQRAIGLLELEAPASACFLPTLFGELSRLPPSAAAYEPPARPDCVVLRETAGLPSLVVLAPHIAPSKAEWIVLTRRGRAVTAPQLAAALGAAAVFGHVERALLALRVVVVWLVTALFFLLCHGSSTSSSAREEPASDRNWAWFAVFAPLWALTGFAFLHERLLRALRWRFEQAPGPSWRLETARRRTWQLAVVAHCSLGSYEPYLLYASVVGALLAGNLGGVVPEGLTFVALFGRICWEIEQGVRADAPRPLALTTLAALLVMLLLVIPTLAVCRRLPSEGVHVQTVLALLVLLSLALLVSYDLWPCSRRRPLLARLGSVCVAWFSTLLVVKLVYPAMGSLSVPFSHSVAVPVGPLVAATLCALSGARSTATRTFVDQHLLRLRLPRHALMAAAPHLSPVDLRRLVRLGHSDICLDLLRHFGTCPLCARPPRKRRAVLLSN